MARRDLSSRRQSQDALAVLGLAGTVTERDINEARRRLAKQAHPDAGGSVEQMQLINDAAATALRDLAAPTSGRSRPPSQAPSAPRAGRPAPRSPLGHGGIRRDHPSFTVEALPAETFEALVVVASWMGDLIDDDPPYGLEVALSEPFGGWCRLDLVPDAGSSTVSITVAGAPGLVIPSVDDVRDAFVEGLNRLDWGTLHD